ncbi:protein EFR3 homolog B-like isoform X2 [Hetaerina americana]|uniref:protein EFR3 homolog B-like isoform X2 n=1 Tax=Hetaerina americana TaxID=62018 RepID=UPI003A7F51B5
MMRQFFLRRTETMTSNEEILDKWDNMSQTLIAVLTHVGEKEISQAAQYQLLDMIITATRMPIGYRKLRACLPETLLSLLLKVAGLGDIGANLRSLKLLQHIIDRHSLRFHVSVPRIFRESDHFAKIKSNEDDLEYFRLQRKDVYDSLYRSFLTHSNVMSNLEALFCAVCLILIEVQYPHTARDIAELMVNIQDAVINIPDLPIQSPRVSAWIHSTVISVLSFIACIHGLTDLKTLVSEVVSRRSEVAPFLIPPLKAKYTIGDITDFKEDVFFNHVLVRRCLTNACFDNRKIRIENTVGISAVMPEIE